MKTLKGLYLEEVEFVLENMQRNSEVTIKKELNKNSSFSVFFEDESLYKKIEEMLYFSQKDYGYAQDNNSKFYSDDYDDDFEK